MFAPVTLASIPSPSTAVWHLNLGFVTIPLRAYALCIIAGIVVACIVTDRRMRSRGAPPWSILDIAITGPDAAAFSFDPLVPAMLYEQQFANLPIHFIPTAQRNYLATLTIVTDQGAALGSSGSVFTYTLRGGGNGITPEPTSLAMLGSVTVWLRRKR